MLHVCHMRMCKCVTCVVACVRCASACTRLVNAACPCGNVSWCMCVHALCKHVCATLRVT